MSPQTLDPEFQGTGLGLSICKMLANILGASIEVDSTEDVGTTFCLIFNARAPNPGEEKQKITSPKLLPKKYHRALLADDSLVSLYILEKVCDNAGISNVSARNGLQACEAFKKGAFDLVLMDLNMPVMNGFEAIKEIRRHARKDCKIVAISVSRSKKIEDTLKELGVGVILTKPVNRDRLVKIVTGAFEIQHEAN